MPRLHELANLIRSKNAGPFELTFDVMFADVESYEHVVRSQVLTTATVAELMGRSESDVHLVEYRAGLAIKWSVPRLLPAGDLGDTDVVGCQQYAPFVDLIVPPLPEPADV